MFIEQGFQHLYCYSLGNTPKMLVDNSKNVVNFDRIAYSIELLSNDFGFQYLWISMDPFNDNVANIGVPERNIYQTPVHNAYMCSNVWGVNNGMFSNGCAIDFTPHVYKPRTPLDSKGKNMLLNNESCYGCMQIYMNNSCMFAYNNFKYKGCDSDLGIGNCNFGTHKDWTFTSNSNLYSIARLNVFARPSLASLLIAESKLCNMRYSLDIPIFQKHLNYAVDSHRYKEKYKPFKRVSYMLHLTHFDNTVDYIWISLDSFTPILGEITVPKGATVQKVVTNLIVTSNILNLNNFYIQHGLLEFSPYNYAAGTSNMFGVKESLTGEGNYGCFQLHANGQTLFAYNSHKGIPDIGIGHNTMGYGDWTFSQNGHLYQQRKLEIYTSECEVCKHVNESFGMRLVQCFDIQGYGRPIPKVNNRITKGSFSRIGYYIQLASFKDGIEWMWISFDINKHENIEKYVVYNFDSINIQETVTNVEVIHFTNNSKQLANYKSATLMNTCYNYMPTVDKLNVRKDILNFGNYGGFQIFTENEHIFCYNNHNGCGDIGFGNNLYGNPDWSFANNSLTYSQRYMEILVNNTTYNPNVVFLVTGQSNSQGWGGVYEQHNPDDGSNENIYAWNLEEQAWVIFDMEKPMGTKPVALQSFAFHFAKKYISEHKGVKVGLIISGLAGQAICKWTKQNSDYNVLKFKSIDTKKLDTGELYDESVMSISQSLKAANLQKLSGILWHQGEGDYLESYDYYKSRLYNVINQYRSEKFGTPTTPFIAGELIYNNDLWQYKKQNEVLCELNDHTDVYIRCAHTMYLPSNINDLVHFSTQSHRAMGHLYYQQWKIIETLSK